MRTRTIWLVGALLAVLVALCPPSHAQEPVNLLTNGDFETGDTAPWNIHGGSTMEVVRQLSGAAIAEGPIEGNYCLHVTTVPTANWWDTAFTQGIAPFEQGKKYTLSAYLKCKSGTAQVNFKPELAADPWTGYGEQTMTMTDEWQEYSITTPVFTATAASSEITFHVGFAAGEFWMDAVRWYEGDYVPPAFLKDFSAKDPTPQDGAVDMPREVVLGWEAGPFAATHNVYLGMAFEDVNDADAANPGDVLIGQGQTAATLDPEGLLEFNKTYYWRVDEVNGAPDSTVFKGRVWSFTTEPYAYAVTGVTATASSFAVGMGPEKTVNGSGLADGQHSSADTDMWLTGQGQPLPAWIQYDLGQVYKLVDMTVWNQNQKVEAFIGFGAKSVLVEYSLDGETWSTLGTVEIPQAPGQDGYEGSVVDMAGAEGRFVRLTIQSTWGGIFPQTGLSEVRFTYVPVVARAPVPAVDATGVSLTPVLSWRPGREAVSHEVYLSEDMQAVADGTAPADTASGNTYEADGLEYGRTYYWKVNEVNDAAEPAVREGAVWNFTSLEFAAIDDFESYNDDDNRIYQSWIDGYADGSSGSTVGYIEAPFAERSITHGGMQSMPLAYDNSTSPFYSEAERAFASAQNWTGGGATELSVWTRGYPVLETAAVTETGGKMSLTGAGTDIWGNSDEFTFAYKTLTGDGTMVARVTGIGPGSNTWAKGGVMIRDSVNGGSTQAMMVMTANTDGAAGNGASFQYRATTGGISANNDSTAAVAPPYWVKIERSGDTFTGYTSANGTTWSTVGSTIITMEDPVQIGVCVTSHLAGEDRTYQFEGIAATGAVTGAWQGAVIDSPQYNAAADMYLIVEDSAGKTAMATSATAVNVADWTQWKIPMSDLAGVNMAKVEKLVIGVGDKAAPTAGGAGIVFIDDIGFGRSAQ